MKLVQGQSRKILSATRTLWSDDEEPIEDFLDCIRSYRRGVVVDEPDEPTPDERSEAAWELRAPILMQLPPCERTIVELARQGLSLVDIADRIDASVGFVTWRMIRARRRLRILVHVPVWTPEEVEARLCEAGVSPEDAHLVGHWWGTSSQSQTARAIERSQTHVWRRVIAVCAYLRGESLRGRSKALFEALDFFRREGRNIRASASEAPQSGIRTPGINSKRRSVEGLGAEKERANPESGER